MALSSDTPGICDLRGVHTDSIILVHVYLRARATHSSPIKLKPFLQDCTTHLPPIHATASTLGIPVQSTPFARPSRGNSHPPPDISKVWTNDTYNFPHHSPCSYTPSFPFSPVRHTPSTRSSKSSPHSNLVVVERAHRGRPKGRYLSVRIGHRT